VPLGTRLSVANLMLPATAQHGKSQDNDSYHPNVLRLRKHTSHVEFILRTIVGLLPLSLRSRLEASYPEWLLLPVDIVLKGEKEDWEEEFSTEMAAYETLRPLQGLVIPRYYGDLCYDGDEPSSWRTWAVPLFRARGRRAGRARDPAAAGGGLGRHRLHGYGTRRQHAR